MKDSQAVTLAKPRKSAAERSRLAKDRARQRRNIKARAMGQEIEKTPLQIQREQQAVAGNSTMPTNKNSRVRLPKRETSESALDKNTDHDEVDGHGEDDDEYGDDDDNDEDYHENNLYQRRPNEQDILGMDMVNRNGVSVPRLASTLQLNREDLEKQNATELASVLAKQSNACIFEMLVVMQKDDPSGWRKLQSKVLKLSEDERTQDIYAVDRVEDERTEAELNHLSSPRSLDGGSDNEEDESDDEEEIRVPENHPQLSHLLSNTGENNIEHQKTVSFHAGQTAEDIMIDINAAFRFHHGERMDSTTRALQASSEISEARQYRFASLAIEKSARQQRVKEIRASTIPVGIRAPAVMRAAFDSISRELQGPKGHWEGSAEWFLSTLDVIDSEPNLCLMVFEPRTLYFRADLKAAMIQADSQRSLELLEKQPFEVYADLVGAEDGKEFCDSFLFFQKR